MRTIRLTTPLTRGDRETKTEYDADKITGIKSVVGDDDQEGTHFWIAGSFERQFCLESARQVRQMIDDAMNSEEVQLCAEAVALVMRAVQSEDGALHFIESDGFLSFATSDFASEPFGGRARSQYDQARAELVRQGFIVSKGGGSYHVTQRGYEMGDHLAGGPLDKPFRGFLRLSARLVESAPTMIFNQTNNNKGDVNNAISEKGNVVQNVTKITSATSGKDRLFIDDIDSFSKVRGVTPDTIAPLLNKGYLNLLEDTVQKALEEILGVPFHKLDSPDEYNDLFTANIIVDGTRRQAAFMLKGRGEKAKTMEIKHCGENGDQVVRLFQSPATLFVIQFVGNISEAVISHARNELAALRAKGQEGHFLTIDGQDTARLMYAYGKLALPPTALLPAPPPG
jgi:hypothetical protein